MILMNVFPANNGRTSVVLESPKSQKVSGGNHAQLAVSGRSIVGLAEQHPYWQHLGDLFSHEIEAWIAPPDPTTEVSNVSHKVLPQQVACRASPSAFEAHREAKVHKARLPSCAAFWVGSFLSSLLSSAKTHHPPLTHLYVFRLISIFTRIHDSR